MIYAINFSKKAFKELEKINEPYYSNIKQAIISLTKNPRPQGYKKLIGRDRLVYISINDNNVEILSVSGHI